jgi:clan AA aspartic protease
MMSGRLNARREPMLSVTVHGPTGISRTVDALVDTGFGRQLTLPPSVIRVLALPWLRRDYAILANGSIAWFEVYVAEVDWDGGSRRVEVQAVDAQPLLGIELMFGHDLAIRMTDGGPVTITAIP